MTDSLAAAAWYDNNVVVQALVANAYERGVAAGRAQAAADIRAHAERWKDSPSVSHHSLEVLRKAAELAECLDKENTDA